MKPGIYTVKYYTRRNIWKISLRKTTSLALDHPELALAYRPNAHIVCRVDSIGPVPAFARAGNKIINFIKESEK